MSKPYYTKLKLILESENGDLKDFPRNETLTFEYDVTDANIWVYSHIMKQLLSAQGFCEKNIEDLLGDR